MAMEKKHYNRLINWFKGRDKSQDWSSIIDPEEVDESLTYKENKAILLDKYSHLLPKNVREIKGDKEEVHEVNVEEAEKETKQADIEEEKELNKILSAKNVDLDKYFYHLEHYIKMLVKSDSHSLLITGEGGLGKTYVVHKTLNQIDLKANKGYMVLSTKVTPLRLYQLLLECQQGEAEVLVLDDVVSILTEPTTLSILKSALWGIGEDRFVQYHSTSDKASETVKKFKFTKKVIVVVNEVPKGMDVDALKSRCLYYNTNFTFEEKKRIAVEIAKLPYKSLTLEERTEVVQFLINSVTHGTINFNFRLLKHFYDIYTYSKGNEGVKWKELAKQQIEDDEIILKFWEIERLDLPAKDKITKWKEDTAMSRATYYRYKNNLKN